MGAGGLAPESLGRSWVFVTQSERKRVMQCPKCGYSNPSESPFCGLCKEVLKTMPRGQDSHPRADTIDSQVESAESFESWHQKGAGLRSQLSKTSRFLVSAIGLIAAIACFYWVVTQTGPAVPVIAIQSKLLGGRFFAMLTFLGSSPYRVGKKTSLRTGKWLWARVR